MKVNDSGDDDYLFGGPANVAFDRNGYAWIANNVVQGTPNSGTFIMVLRPDGKPADGRDGTPTSPVFGGGLKGPGWGVTVAPNGHVWVGNFGWGPGQRVPEATARCRSSRRTARRSRPEPGYAAAAPDRVQATVADADGNIWMASYGNGDVVVFPGGDPGRAQSLPSGSLPVRHRHRPGRQRVGDQRRRAGMAAAPEGSVTRFRMDATAS